MFGSLSRIQGRETNWVARRYLPNSPHHSTISKQCKPIRLNEASAPRIVGAHPRASSETRAVIPITPYWVPTNRKSPADAGLCHASRQRLRLTVLPPIPWGRVKAVKCPRVTLCKKIRPERIFFLHAGGFGLFNATDALARANGPSGLCNDVTRPFWIVWQTLVPRGKWSC